jgi:hypothetical protein
MSRSPWPALAAVLLLVNPMAVQAADEERAAPVVTSTAAAEESAAAAEKRDAEPEVVCRVEAEIGSRVKKKVCRRKSDIEAQRAETQDALPEVRSLGNKNYSAAPGN